MKLGKKYLTAIVAISLVAALLFPDAGTAPGLRQVNVSVNENLAPHINLNAALFIDAFNRPGDVFVPDATVDALTGVFNWDENIAAEVTHSIVLFLQTRGRGKSTDDIIAASKIKKGDFFIKQIYVFNQGAAVSVVDRNNAILRFTLLNGRLLFQEIGKSNRGNMSYPDQSKLVSLSNYLDGGIGYLIRQEGIAIGDLDRLFWAIPESSFFYTAEGNVRQIFDDEMYFILSTINDSLLKSGIQPADDLEFKNDFMRDLGSMDQRNGVRLRLNLDQRVKDHRILFRAMSPEPDEFLVFLARDAISAHEFFHYMQVLSGLSVKKSGIVYYPGLPQRLKLSNHAEDAELIHAQQLVTKIFEETKNELGFAKLSVLKEKPDETVADQRRYEEFVSRFRERIFTAIKTDAKFAKEAAFIYAQLKRVGAVGYKKIRIVDLNASGKTALYVKCVFDYFFDKGKGDIDSSRVFVGNGRGHDIGLPKVRHYFPNLTVKFPDVMWPFQMNGRDRARGDVHFGAIKSRYLSVLHVYHSLRLFNEAVEYFNELQSEEAMEVPENIMTMTKQLFMDAYNRNHGAFRPGFFGADKAAVSEKLNEWFGENNWKLSYLVGGKLVSREETLQLYEDAYVEYFRANPEPLEWLLAEAKDVYDNALSNVGRMDYADQETPDNHYHDIAIRRAVKRLGRSFQGERLIQIRGPQSEGYFLNPGYVPFHRPELIIQPQLAGWWKPYSIEGFYQSAKAIILISAAVEPQTNEDIRPASVVNESI